MRIFTILCLLLVPSLSQAEHIDNISFTIKPDCSMEKYLSLVDEFRANPTVQKHGYKVKILSPIASSNMTINWWEGTTKTLDDYLNFVSDMRKKIQTTGSPENKLMAKFNQCITNHARATHDEPFEIDISNATHLDVWGIKIRDNCSLQEWVAFSGEFNDIVKPLGMQGNIKAPVITPDINGYYWVNYANSHLALQAAQAKFDAGSVEEGSKFQKIQQKVNECIYATSRETFTIIDK